MVWGESNLFQTVGAHWSLPGRMHTLDDFAKKGTDMWMAVLNPEKQKFEKALKRLAEDVFPFPGYARWGKKETKWNQQMILFFLHGWPDAQIVFLTRNVEMSFTSQFKTAIGYVPQHGNRESDIVMWILDWINQAELVLSNASRARCAVIKYEDLVAGPQAIQSLCASLGLPKSDLTKCSAPVSVSPRKSGETRIRNICDCRTLLPYWSRVHDLSKRLGYPGVQTYRQIQEVARCY